MVELEKQLTLSKEDKSSIREELTACEARFEEVKASLAHAREVGASADARRRDSEADLSEAVARADAAEALCASKEAMVRSLKEALALSKTEIEALNMPVDRKHPSLLSDTTVPEGADNACSDGESALLRQELADVKEELEKARLK